ncbi:hypothetical protein GE300_02765 [Rhodobacteraceae bacterium 2CG4]|uniref:Uncharacterized protein n=1 Tax=Halovulum marinum TaxID=2662447 RepID=A0A6L5YX42_9RHOB|nr:hypothetical protein [Halovulum marinum]MSU88540.1 hypothetical protein [Halovulum marinum]
MSIPAFMLRAFWITPQVMLRFLPVLVCYILISVGLFFATDNPWVIGLILFLLGTFGYAFVVVQGLRAALQALKLTAAPTASGLMTATARMLFVYFLLQLLLLLLFGSIIGAVFYFIVIPAMDPAAAEVLRALVEARSAGAGAPPASFVLNQLQAEGSTAIMLLNLAFTLLLGVVMAVFGAPMAAIAANAVQYSPNHDLIYGLGRYVPHQVLLYLLLVALPSAFFGHLPAKMMLTMEPSWTSMGALAAIVLVYSLFAVCLPWSGMALAYGEVREKIRRQRQAEKMPEIDYEAARADLRSLRQTRTADRSGTTLYDPLSPRPEPPPADG